MRAKVLAVFNTKGGSGKSTTSIHVGVAASAGVKAAILDCDPNESSLIWRRTRTADYPMVTKASSARIMYEIGELKKQGIELIILDCPPAINADTTTLIAAADFVVVPVQPTILDVAGCHNATKMIRAQKKPFTYLISRCPTPSQDTREAIAALEQSGEVCPVVIGDRVAFSRALAYGMAVTEFEETGKAHDETLQACNWILQRMGVKINETQK